MGVKRRSFISAVAVGTVGISGCTEFINGGIEVRNVDYEDRSRGKVTRFTGEVFNPGRDEVRGVRVTVTLLDDNRKVVGSNFKLMTVTIPSEASISFRIDVTAGLDEWAEYEFSLDEGPF